jgi:hypothetical protein
LPFISAYQLEDALLRTKRALALVIAVMVSASLLAGLYLPRLLYRGRIIIRAYAMGSGGGLTQLTNASFSVWAWAPTPNGTEFMPVYNGTGPQAVIGLSRLASWAEDWIHAYGKAAIRSLAPSIIIWVSYSIALPNGSVELVTQPSFQPLNLSLPLSGIWGVVVNVVVDHPFRTLVKANGEGAGIAVRGLAKVSPGQTTATVTTTPTTSTASSICGRGVCDVWYLAPHIIKWYPNDTGMAPISLAVALGQPSSVSEGYANPDVVIIITVASAYVNQFTINGLMIAGAMIDAVVDDVEVGDLLQAISQLFPALGTTSTFTTKGEVTAGNGTTAYIPSQNEKGPDIAQLYIVGQVALVNWTAYTLPLVSNTPVAWYLSLQLTEFKAVESNGAVAPVIYNWWAYDPCVNLSEWAHEQQVLMQNSSYFFGTGMNSTCPLPNTPAPVIWKDYATNLTYFTTKNPNSQQQYSYVDFFVNGGELPLGIGIDAGSAMAWIIETVLMVSQPEVGDAVEVIGALLGAFQYQSYSVAVTVNNFLVSNTFPRGYYVNVYFSNLTPMYTVSDQGFTLPNELILINVTS